MTNTEKIIAKLNYHSATKEPESFVSAMEGIVNIFSSQVSNGLKNEREIVDFGEMLSVVNYIGAQPDKYQNIMPYFENSILNNVNSNKNNYEENHTKVA